MDYAQLKNMARLKSFDHEDADSFAHFATLEILDARQARLIHEELVHTLTNVSVGPWLGPTVASSLRNRAMTIIDEIEKIVALQDAKHPMGQNGLAGRAKTLAGSRYRRGS